MSENFDKKLGEKLRDARMKVGMTQEDVAQKMGESQETISSIENGARKLKAQELSRLAKLYFKDVAFFLSSDVQEQEEECVVYWRECPENSIAKVKEQEFLNFCNHYYDLEKRLDLSHTSSLKQFTYRPDDFDFNKIEDIAVDLSNEMQLGLRPACSLRKILEEKYNIKILYYDIGLYGSAASAIGKFGYAILINSSEPERQRNSDLAHELFHILTWNIFKHEDVHRNDGQKSIVERYADSFAESLLLPQVEVVREFKSKIKDNIISFIDLVGIARDFEVSTESLMNRLVTLKLLDKKSVNDVLKSTSFKDIDKLDRSNENKHVFHSSDRYISLAFKAFTKGLISKGKLADYLSVNISDVSKTLSEHGYNLEGIYDAEIIAA